MDTLATSLPSVCWFGLAALALVLFVALLFGRNGGRS